jgi:excisionase family DNA binding protein
LLETEKKNDYNVQIDKKSAHCALPTPPFQQGMRTMNERVFTTVDVAKLCKVSLRTVIRWVDDGKLPSFRTTGGHRRVREEDLMKFMGQYKIPFTVGSRNEAKKILILEEKKDFDDMLHQILRRSSDLFEITHAKDLFECAMRLGLLKPDLVVLELGSKTQDVEKFFKSMSQLPETRDTCVLILNRASSGMKKSKALSTKQHTVIQEPFTIETVRPYLLEIFGDSPTSSS